MNDMSDARRSRGKRVAVLRTVASVAFLAAYLLMKHFDSVMKDDPVRSPPQLQMRSQAIQLADPIKNNVVSDDEVGFILPPGLDQAVETYDYTFRRISDDRGFPNESRWPESADIVFLGDSLIMGEGVGVGSGFVALIDQALNEKSVVNLGIMGAGLERQYRLFRDFGASLEPELIVACLYVASDLAGDTQFADWLENPQGETYNEFRLAYERRHDRSSWLVRRLQTHPVYYWLVSAVEPHLWGDRKVMHSLLMQDGTTLLFDRNTVKFAKRPFSGDDPVFMRFSESLTRLESIAEQQNAAVVFVLIPSKEEIFAEDVTVKPNSAVEVIKAELNRREISYLDLYPILKRAGMKQTPYFTRDIHLNEYGNRTVARAFGEWIAATSNL